MRHPSKSCSNQLVHSAQASQFAVCFGLQYGHDRRFTGSSNPTRVKLRWDDAFLYVAAELRSRQEQGHHEILQKQGGMWKCQTTCVTRQQTSCCLVCRHSRSFTDSFLKVRISCHTRIQSLQGLLVGVYSSFPKNLGTTSVVPELSCVHTSSVLARSELLPYPILQLALRQNTAPCGRPGGRCPPP